MSTYNEDKTLDLVCVTMSEVEIQLLKVHFSV